MKDLINNHYPYSPGFQLRILAALVQDFSLYPRYYGIWKAEYFTDPINRIIAGALFEYRESNATSPVYETILNYVVCKYVSKDQEFQQKLVDRITELYETSLDDQEWSEKMVIDWAKSQALAIAVWEGAQFLTSGQKEKIKPLVDEAYRVGDDISKVGLVITKDTQTPSSIILQQKKNKIPTGFSDLDPLIEGGVGGGELFIFLGPPKGFKSGNMLNATIPALQSPFGKNVTYITLELKEEKVMERYCYRLTGLNKEFLLTKTAEFDQKFEDRVQKILTGKLAIKNYPTRSATASTMRRYLDMLESQGHKTDLLIVDYGNIMKPERNYNSDYTGIGENFESLRSIAVERDIPVITAARTNREGLMAEDLRMEHIAGSMEIAACADYVVALIQTEQEHKEWSMRHKLLLNRNEDCGIIIGNNIDYPSYTINNCGIINKEEEYKETGYNAVEKAKKESSPKFTSSKIDSDKLNTLKNILAGGNTRSHKKDTTD